MGLRRAYARTEPPTSALPPHILNRIDQESIERSVLSTRLRGYAKRSMHSAEKVTGIALPVFDRRGYPVASVCVVLPTESLDKQGLVTVLTSSPA